MEVVIAERESFVSGTCIISLIWQSHLILTILGSHQRTDEDNIWGWSRRAEAGISTEVTARDAYCLSRLKQEGMVLKISDKYLLAMAPYNNFQFKFDNIQFQLSTYV